MKGKGNRYALRRAYLRVLIGTGIAVLGMPSIAYMGWALLLSITVEGIIQGLIQITRR
jgi:hypothetical protein